MATPIPMCADLAELIGPYAHKIENRSLLLEKFALPKNWIDGDFKRDQATRWSLLRITPGGRKALMMDADRARRNAANPKDSKTGFNASLAAKMLPELSRCASPQQDIMDIRKKHSFRMLELLAASPSNTHAWFTARLESRMAINLAEGVIENAGICLDRLFGMPYIPGSALKGCSRHAALKSIKETDPRFISVFGNTEQKGGVSFLAAYPLDGIDENILEVDLSNVHYPTYYVGRSAGRIEELKNESPKPNPFPVVKAGVSFGFIIVLNSIGKQEHNPAALLSSAMEYLQHALTQEGIGAKTSAGYGWFSLTPEMDEQIIRDNETKRIATAEADAVRRVEEESRIAEEARINALDPIEREMDDLQKLDHQAFAEAVNNALESPAERQQAILRLVFSPERKETLKKYRKGAKPTDAKRWEIVQKLALEHNFIIP